MATAKEQARASATEGWPSYLHPLRIGGADAASDVWEPLLREAYEALDRAVPRADTYETLVDRALQHQRALNRLKEALGE